jgi:hypothetical protein
MTSKLYPTAQPLAPLSAPGEAPKLENLVPPIPTPQSVPEGQIPISPEAREQFREWGKQGGRPKGSESEMTRMKRMMRETLIQQVHDRFGDLVTAKFDLAQGHFMYITDIDPATGKERVKRIYSTAPDSKSIEYLMDQVIDKPTQKFREEAPEDLQDIELTEEEKAHIQHMLKYIDSAYGGD